MRLASSLPKVGNARDAVIARPTLAGRWLDGVERLGNRCPDPILLFLIALAVTWLASSLLDGVDLGLDDPRTGHPLHHQGTDREQR